MLSVFYVYMDFCPQFLHPLPYLPTPSDVWSAHLEPMRDICPPFLSSFGPKHKPSCLYVPQGSVIRCSPLLSLLLPVFQESAGVGLESTVKYWLDFNFPLVS